jgi:hypothetical protein
MPTILEKACLGCTLDICDDRSAECKFVTITRNEKDAEAKLKEDIITILGRLVGEKAVDEARARATNGEL